MSITLVSSIRFPELSLQTRDAHKLRGFFGQYFKNHSSLLHNHYEDGTLRYKYPLVQYKVIDNLPVLIALNEGAELLTSLFLKINHINLNGQEYPVYSKNIEQRKIEAGISQELHEYQFKTLWMALNQGNYKEYINLNDREKSEKLNQLMRNNILSFFKGLNIWIEEKIMVKGHFKERETKFKDNKMLAFSGTFVTNAVLPDYIGLGKSVSRGFGTIEINKHI